MSDINLTSQGSDDDDRSRRTAVSSEFQAAGPDIKKLRDRNRDSREHGILLNKTVDMSIHYALLP